MKIAFLEFLCCASLAAQLPAVRMESVKAHEAFLASDALQGRGSATRDEWIAATYIGSQFEAFGLKPAPGTPGYVQPVGLETLQPDGKAQLRIGRRILREGSDFYLSASSGAGVNGALQVTDVAGLKTAKFEKDSIVLIRGALDRNAQRGIGALASQGVRMVILEASKAQLDAFAAGARTRVPTTIQGVTSPAARSTLTTVLLPPATAARLRKAKSGKPAALTVQSTPVSKTTYNAMAFLHGTDAAAETILITAHLDHLGVVGSAASGDNIFNGADDDASGVTAVLEISRALAAAPPSRRSVLFICFGSEEAGGFGARWFLDHPPVPLKQIVANIEFEMIGVSQDKVPVGTMFLTGWERSNLGPTLKEHGALLGADPFPEMNFFQRSDNYALALRGVVAQTAGAGGEVPTYHKANDDIAHIDIPLMTQLIQSMIEPLRWLSNSDFKPAWNPGAQPGAR